MYEKYQWCPSQFTVQRRVKNIFDTLLFFRYVSFRLQIPALPNQRKSKKEIKKKAINGKSIHQKGKQNCHIFISTKRANM
jgi:hypothetical protein